MNDTILYTIVSLSSVGVVAAAVLYVVAQRFKVYEDPRIAETDELLPGANCGGCGFPGCKVFAEELVKSDDISQMHCPVGGNEVMESISKLLGKEVTKQKPTVAVIQCQGSCLVRPQTSLYDGPMSCEIEALLYGGESDCEYGCVGGGDCVDVCDFDAMYMDEETGMPVVITDKCTGCEACVKACPKDIIEMRPKNKRDLKIYVACKNLEKGGIAKKSCELACIGCSKCVKVCTKDAITIENNLAYIDPDKCSLCRKCVDECPTHSILATNFPEKKKKKPVEKKVESKTDVEKTPVAVEEVTTKPKKTA